MKKIINIQALRGIAVLLVILFHMVTVEQKYGGTTTILPSWLSFGMFGVDLFFVISGFIMIVITKGNFKNLKYAIHFLYNRVSRIYPTYWFYSLIILTIFVFEPSLVNSSQNNEVNIVASFLLLPSDRLPLLMVGWTLIHEMYFYIVYFFILLFVSEKHLVHILIFWSIVIIGVNLFFKYHTPFEGLIFNPLTLEFILGCFIAIYHFNKYNTFLKTNLLLFFAFTGFMIAIAGYQLYTIYITKDYISGWWRVLIFGFPALIIVFSFTNIEQHGFTLHSILTKIGDASYSIYLSHILTLSAIGRVWSTFSSDAIWDNYIMIPVLFLSVIIVGILSYKYIEKPLIVYSRKIHF